MAWEFYGERVQTIIYDGKGLRAQYGLDAAYRPYELDGKPILIGKKDDMYVVVYDNEQVGPPFDEITIGHCCEIVLYAPHFGEGRYVFGGNEGAVPMSSRSHLPVKPISKTIGWISGLGGGYMKWSQSKAALCLIVGLILAECSRPASPAMSVLPTPTTQQAPTATPVPAENGIHTPEELRAPFLGRDNAISKGLKYARQAGLVGEPTFVTIAKMDYLQYRSLVDRPGTKLSGVGSRIGRQLWVLGFEGKIVLCLPGAVGEQYDYLLIALDAQTGDELSLAAYPPGREPDFQGQQVTLADGAWFPIGDEDTALR